MATRRTGIIAGLAVAGLAAAGVITSTVTANADPTAAPSSNPTASAPDKRAGHEHTSVTGDEAQKVIDAVKARFADATVITVEKDPDGSYDVRGTRSDGTRMMYEVSADLATITEGAGRGGPGGRAGDGGRDHGRGHGGVSQDTPVTGDEAQKVMDAVTARFADVTIKSVRKDPDSSYDALGSRADGTKVMYDVSTDLQTITENAKR